MTVDPGSLDTLMASRYSCRGFLPDPVPRETIERAAGATVSEQPLLDYLEAKFGALYRL